VEFYIIAIGSSRRRLAKLNVEEGKIKIKEGGIEIKEYISLEE